MNLRLRKKLAGKYLGDNVKMINRNLFRVEFTSKWGEHTMDLIFGRRIVWLSQNGRKQFAERLK